MKVYRLLFISLFFFIFLACEQKEVKLSFYSVNKEHLGDFRLEIADSSDEIRQGLMYRKEMPENFGMLFIFPDLKPRSFWMKNTYLELDMIFLNEKGEVLSIIPKAAPLSTDPRKSLEPAKYVVELLGGSSKKFGIEKGSFLDLSNLK